MQRTQGLVVLLVASVVAVSSVFALFVIQSPFQGTGSVRTVGLEAYWDSKCVESASSVDWGLLEPGSSESFTLYLRNEGNSVLNLSLTSEAWSPASTEDYMTLTWNREGQQINPNQVMDCSITLHVSDSVPAIGSFSLSIIVSGTG